MTDPQLKVLLDGLLVELGMAMNEVRDLMPEDAERIPRRVLVYKDDGQPVGYVSPFDQFVLVGAVATGGVVSSTEEDPNGDFVALSPLVELINDWRVRFEALEDGGA